jgi:catalase
MSLPSIHLTRIANTPQFCPTNIIRGIDYSDDPLLQGRLFSYRDAALNRNGGNHNFQQIPINRPRVPVHNNHRDGAQQQYIPINVAAYSGSTLGSGSPMPANQTQGKGFFTAPQRKIVDANYIRQISPTFLDYWTQPRLFWNSLLPIEQQSIVDGARLELSKVRSESTRKAALVQFNRIDHGLAKRVAAVLGMEAPAADETFYHNNSTANMSVFRKTLPTAKGMRVAILASTDSKQSIKQGTALKNALKELGISGLVIAETLVPGVDGLYATENAALYDAAVVVDYAKKLLSTSASAPHRPTPAFSIVSDAYHFGKPIAVLGNNARALQKSGIAKQGEPGVYAQSNVQALAMKLEGGLKTFKFLNRFPVDQ